MEKTRALCLLVLAVSAFVVYGEKTVMPHEEKPQKFLYQDGCYVKEVNAVIKFGDSVKTPSCLKLDCRLEGVVREECDEVVAGNNTVRVVNPNLQYPECCPRLKPVDDDSLNIDRE